MTAAPDQQLATDDCAEWLVGIAPLPTYIHDNGIVYRTCAATTSACR
jgi:hypothetical protein